MKTIDVDEELYRYIASHTQHIGESATDILRRMLKFTDNEQYTSQKSLDNITAVENTASRPQAPIRAVRELLLSDEYAQQKRAVSRFMLILSTLYSLDPKMFTEATESLQGRTRLYFSGNQQVLLQHGNHTKPKHVPGTPYWVITNTNTGRKSSMIKHIMLTMQFPVGLIEKVCGTL